MEIYRVFIVTGTNPTYVKSEKGNAFIHGYVKYIIGDTVNIVLTVYGVRWVIDLLW